MDLLCADIGGTHSRFALFRAGESGLELRASKWLETKHYAGFRELTEALLTDPPLYDPADPPARAALAVPGPVENGVFCLPPNIGWPIRLEEASLPGIPQAAMLNDFEAQAWAALWGRSHPADVDLVEMIPGAPKAGAPIAVIGAGTGLGKSLILPSTAGHPALTLPSEGGHGEVPFILEDGDFPRFLREKTGHLSLSGDDVLGGAGLGHLFAYHTGLRLPDKEVPAKLPDHPDVLRHYAEIYGRVCRNFVLDTLALGGLVITGGMAWRVPVLAHPAFAASFRFCPSLPGLLDQVPVHQMRDPAAGLYGAAMFARNAFSVAPGRTV